MDTVISSDPPTRGPTPTPPPAPPPTPTDAGVALPSTDARELVRKQVLLQELRRVRRERRAQWEAHASRRADMDEAVRDARSAVPSPTIRQAEVAFLEEELAMARASRRRVTTADFETLVVVGKGAYGEVSLVRNKIEGRVYAMKKMTKVRHGKKNSMHRMLAERDAVVSVAPDWIAPVHAMFQDESWVYIVLEFCCGGDLMGILMREDVLTESVARFIAAELIMAIESVHNAGFIHRDIKPDNILIDDDGHIRLSDFGLCTRLDKGMHPESRASSEESRGGGGDGDGGGVGGGDGSRGVGDEEEVGVELLAMSRVGTPDFIAPEVLWGKGYGKEVDWWSLGAVLFECLMGYAPFHTKTAAETCQRVVNWKRTLFFPPARTAALSADCVDFMQQLLKGQNERLGRRGVAEVKHHPWMRDVDWARLRTCEGPVHIDPRILAAKEQAGYLSKHDPKLSRTLAALTSSFHDFIKSTRTRRRRSDVPPPPGPRIFGLTFRLSIHEGVEEHRSVIADALRSETEEAHEKAPSAAASAAASAAVTSSLTSPTRK